MSGRHIEGAGGAAGTNRDATQEPKTQCAASTAIEIGDDADSVKLLPALRTIRFSFPAVTPLLNKMIRAHWALRRRRIAKTLCPEVKVATQGMRPSEPFQRVRVTITRFSCAPRLPDYDGLVGGMKPLLDCFVRFNEKVHPFGLDIIEDDAPSCIALLKASAVRVPKRTMQHTEVVIEEIA